MQTLNINQIEFKFLFQNIVNEPIIVKNNVGTDYLILPFSQNNWQEVFFMLFQSFSELQKKEDKTLKENRISAKEFGEKWTGILENIEEFDLKENYHNHLIEKYL